MKNLIRFFQTVRHLKLIQVYFRIYYYLRKPFKFKKKLLEAKYKKIKLTKAINKQDTYIKNSTFFFLNEFSDKSSTRWSQN